MPLWLLLAVVAARPGVVEGDPGVLAADPLLLWLVLAWETRSMPMP